VTDTPPVEKTPEERDKFAAEASWYAASARKAAAEAEAAEHEAEVKKLDRDRAVEKREREKHADDYGHRVYEFTGSVDAGSVKTCMKALSSWHRAYPEEAMEIVFFSPGGAVFPGMQLFDHIQWLKAEGHHVTTTATGYAASMGGILIQAGTKRVMTTESWLMVHEVASGASGKTSDIEDEVEFMKRIQARVLQIFADRAAGTNRPKAITKARLKRLSTRKDCWLSSMECFDFGLVDEVR
jgi:ATP-dependent Clp endopeptidase proteolytic subunit ClpP